MTHRDPAELKTAQECLPQPVAGIPDVYHCGWHSEKSFGAASYLIQRPVEKGGNILVDSPRWVGADILAALVGRARYRIFDTTEATSKRAEIP